MNENFTVQMDGTGANIDIFCGFKPAKVEVMNWESATLEKLEWYNGMPNGHAIKTVSAGTRSKITTLGITLLEDASNGLGFRVGVDTDVNVAGESLTIIAHRAGEGCQQP